MSQLAVPDSAQGGQPVSLDMLVKPVKDRIRQGREHKKQYEANWALNLAFAAGDYWSTWDSDLRTLRRLQDIDPRYRGRELASPDVITEYRTTALGELAADNDRPQLLLARDDQSSEEFQAQLNRGVGYGWNYEWKGDEILSEMDGYVVDLGTAAIQCYYDPTVGKPKAENVPHLNGKPLLDMEQATAAVAQAAENGQTLEFKPIKEGRVTWRAISVLGLITPPGITHEDKFPWECIVRPAYLPDVQELYGDVAADLKEDQDIRTDLGLTMSGGQQGVQLGDSRQSRLRDHVWLFSYYERPSQKYPKGRTVVLASNRMKPLAYTEQLDYVAPDGTYRSGISYFHWWRVTGRFWSRSLIDVMRDPQRGIAKRKTQINEIIDRSMPYVIVEKDSKATQRQGYPMEMIEVGRQEREPKPVSGVPPGAWMQQDVEELRLDLDHATGISGAQRGENPPGVTTYSQLALLHESDQTKRDPIRQARRRSVAQLVEDSIYDMRQYWGPQKQVMLAGDEDHAEAEIFNATKIPPFFIVDVAKGAPKPRTQGAKLQLITDIANYSVQAAQPVTTKWFKESLEAGEPLELPQEDVEDPADKASLENHLMVTTRQVMPIAYYDLHQIHLPIHRRQQDDAMFSNDMELWQIIDQHCQLHVNAAQAQQQAVMDQQAHTQSLGAQAAQNGQAQQQPAPAGGP